MIFRHYYWIKIKTLALMADWDALESFANEKRPPIGWETFVNITIKHNAPTDKIAMYLINLLFKIKMTVKIY